MFSRYQSPYVFVQVFSGTVPFPTTTTPAVPATIMYGGRPDRPTNPCLSDRLWKLAQKCWDDNPKHRPGMEEVTKELNKMYVYSCLRCDPSLLSRENTSKLATPSSTRLGGPSATTSGPQTTVSRRPSARSTPYKTGVNPSRDTVPYDVDTLQPQHEGKDRERSEKLGVRFRFLPFPKNVILSLYSTKTTSRARRGQRNPNTVQMSRLLCPVRAHLLQLSPQ